MLLPSSSRFTNTSVSFPFGCLSWRGWALCGARSYSYERHLGGRNCAGLFGVYIRRDIIVAQSAVIGIDKPNSASAQLFIFHTYPLFYIILSGCHTYAVDPRCYYSSHIHPSCYRALYTYKRTMRQKRVHPQFILYSLHDMYRSTNLPATYLPKKVVKYSTASTEVTLLLTTWRMVGTTTDGGDHHRCFEPRGIGGCRCGICSRNNTNLKWFKYFLMHST